MHKIIVLPLLLIFSFNLNAVQQIANYIGTGSNPKISLVLSQNNGPGWSSFNIDYQGIGNVPWSADSSKDWSPWDVKDQNANYYGSINLRSDGKTVTWNGYSAGTDGYYLEGIKLAYNNNIHAYQLTADKIHRSSSSGPFPNAPLAAPAVYPGTSEKIILSVSKGDIINNKGNKILLKGLARPSLEWDKEGQFLSVQDIKNIREWGSNVIRIDLYQDFWLTSGPMTEPGSYKQIIDAIVYHSIQNGMAIILDLHWTNYGYQSPMANHTSIQFWQEVAKHYKDFGTVLFELYNEPYGIEQNTWLYGNNDYAGYQQLFDAVRSAGAQNICIINGLDYGYNVSFVNDDFKINGTNVVYGSHPYNEKGSKDWTGPGGSFSNNFKNILGKHPIIFTEFGVNASNYFPSGYQQVYERILAYANQHQINYSAFAWWVEPYLDQADVFPCLIKDWNGTPLNGGMQVKQDLLNNPGTPLNIK